MKCCICFLLSILIISCNSNTGSTVANTTDTTAYYPVHNFFIGELKEVENTPFYIYQLTEKDKVKDSLPVSKEAFHKWAAPFMQLGADSASFHNNYQQTAFADNSTNSITLNYAAASKTLPVQSITVLLNSEGDKVKRIFFTAAYTSNDTAYAVKASWKTGEEFYIIKTFA